MTPVVGEFDFDRYADQPFLIDAVQRRTYSHGQFAERVRALAGEVERAGLRSGDRLAIVLPNCPEFAALYFACAMLGAVAVPVNPSLHADEVALLLANCGASVVACSADTQALVPAFSATGVTLVRFAIAPWGTAADSSWALAGRSAVALINRSPVDPLAPLCLMFTSGTTGLPKGILHSRASIVESARAFATALGYDAETRMQHLFPMSYMAGFLNSLMCPFVVGGSVVIGRGFTADYALRFWNEPSIHDVNTFWVSPTMLAAILRVNRQQAGQEHARRMVRAISVGTAPYSRALRDRFEDEYDIATYESYGLSETLFVSTNRPGEPARGVGCALPGVLVEQRESESGSPTGELFIRSPYLMLGTFDIRTGSLEVPGCDWFASGDIGHIDEDANVHIDGRSKDIIIRGGLNISPRSVEDVLEGHAAVESAAVIGVPHEFYGEEVVACVRLRPGYELCEVQPDLLIDCKKRLASHVVPSRFIALPDFPYSVTGKVQKAKLRERVIAAS